MRITTLFVILLGFALVASIAGLDFDSFSNKFRKSYSGSELKRRKAIYQRNMDKIAQMNKKWGENVGWAKFGPNENADLDDEEFKRTRLGLPTPTASDILRSKIVEPSSSASNNYSILRAYSVDETFNWDAKGVVTPVKNQGGCGSCWIFSAIAIIETYYARKTGNLISFSEQQVLDCPPRLYPCQGGWPKEVFDSVKSRGVIPTTKNPYTGIPKTCAANSVYVLSKISSYARVANPNSEQDIINALRNYGTVVMCLNANILNYYYSGILTAAQCGAGAPNHAVTLVGYGTDAASRKKYWRFKNSWGASWGEKGYFRIERNTNACDIQNSYSGYGPWYIVS